MSNSYTTGKLSFSMYNMHVPLVSWADSINSHLKQKSLGGPLILILFSDTVFPYQENDLCDNQRCVSGKNSSNADFRKPVPLLSAFWWLFWNSNFHCYVILILKEQFWFLKREKRDKFSESPSEKKEEKQNPATAHHYFINFIYLFIFRVYKN